MSQVNVTIVYYSATGTLHTMAQKLEAAALKSDAAVRLRHVAEIAPAEAIASNPAWESHVADVSDAVPASHDDITWADVVLFGSPTRFGNVSAQLKMFIDSLGPLWAEGKLADKVYSGFTSTQTPHGGQESTLLALYNSIHHFGGILVAPGYTDPVKFADGNPYGASHVTGPSNDAPLTDTDTAALEHLASRTIGIAAKLKSA